MSALLLRFRLKPAQRRLGDATFERGQGPTLARESALAQQLLSDPAWTHTEVPGHVGGDVRAQERARVIGGGASSAFAALREALEAQAARVAALTPEEGRQYALLVREAGSSEYLPGLLDRALNRPGLEALIADEDAGETAPPDAVTPPLDSAAALPEPVVEPVPSSPPVEPEPVVEADDGRPPFVPPDVLDDPVEPPPAVQARAALRRALVAERVPKIADLLELAQVAGYPSVDDARGWAKQRLVEELGAWLASVPLD